MNKILTVLVAAMIFIPVVTMASGASKDILGTYTVKGYNPGVSTTADPSYTGTLKVSQSGGAYILDWKVGPEGKQTYKGVGVYADGVLSVGFNGGVVSYKVSEDTLKGVWAPFSGGEFGFEHCEKKK